MKRVIACLAAGIVILAGCELRDGGAPAEDLSAAAFDLQGHRGARGLRPENTLAGVAYTLGVGVTTIELDLGVTKDGVVVVSHDRTLRADHTRDATGAFLAATGPAIVDLNYDELRRYDVGRIRAGSDYAAAFQHQQPVDGERIPRLVDVFALVEQSGNRELRFNLEIKIDPERPKETVSPVAFAQALVAVIRESDMTGRVTVQSFDWRALQAIREVAPEIALAALTDQQPDWDTVEAGKPGPSVWLGGLDVDDYGGSVPRMVQALGAVTWSPNALDLTPARVAEAHDLGLLVVPWTVNETADMERALSMGIDGLITDYPDRLRALLEARGIAVPVPTPVK